MKGRGASAGALAPAAGHAPARTHSHRQLLAGALAQRSDVYQVSFLWYISIIIKWRGAIAGALAPATGHASARIPNHCRLLDGALAQRLQHACIILRYMCIVIK